MSTLSQRDTNHVFESLRKGLVPERGIDAFAIGTEKQRGEIQRRRDAIDRGPRDLGQQLGAPTMDGQRPQQRRQGAVQERIADQLPIRIRRRPQQRRLDLQDIQRLAKRCAGPSTT